jgi:hypothetical protein
MLKRSALTGLLLAVALAGSAGAQPKKKQGPPQQQSQSQGQSRPGLQPANDAPTQAVATSPSKHAAVLTARQKKCRARQRCSMDPRDPPCPPCRGI